MEVKSPQSLKSISTKRVSNAPILLLCPKHQNKIIEKICTEISCKFDILMCSDCLEDNQMHICLHKDSLLTFEEFINTCKSLSLNHKFVDGTGVSEKENRLLLDLDKLILLYKNHLKKEEDKIENDINELITNFTKEMNKVKANMKDRLYDKLGVLVNKASNLREAAREIHNEKISNLQINNEFDTFINSLTSATTNKKPFCMKKMVTEVMRVLNNSNSLKNRTLNTISNNTSLFNTSLNKSAISSQKTEILANFTTLNKNCESLVNEVYNILDNKPYYKNQGDARHVFVDAQNTLKSLYYEFEKNSEAFIRFSSTPEEETLKNSQFKKTQSLKDMKIVQLEKPKGLDNVKKIVTNHSKGINCLVIKNDILFTGSLDRSVKSFDLENFSEIRSVNLSSDIISLANVPKGNLILAGCFKEFYALTDDLKIVGNFVSDDLGVVNAIHALKDGMTAVTNAKDGKILFWNIDSQTIVKKKFDHRDVVYTMDVQDTKNILVSGGLDKSIKIWKLNFHREDFKGGCFEKVILENSLEKAHNSDITALRLSNHNSNILLSASANGEIKLWETLHGTLIKSFKSQTSWVFSIKIFEKECSFIKKVNSPLSPKKLWKLSSPTKRLSEKENPAISVDIKDFYFMTTSYDGKLKFWDSLSQKPVFEQSTGNTHDCFPYGGVGVFNGPQTNSFLILTSGNKEDTTVNTWVLK